MQPCIVNKYQINSELGKGKFGQVYKGIRIKDKESVAIKIETSSDYKILKHEATILNYLHTHGSKQIPIVYWYGQFNACPTLVMTYYQNSLEDYIKHKTISQEKLDQIMELLFEILVNIHQHYVIHRDIKPQNIMMKNGELYLIDFGLSTFYVDENFKHVACKKDKEYIIGTPKYISYHVHDGYEPSRRDDLISLGYLYLFIQMGELPWSNIQYYPSSNEVNAPINQERKKMKSWENISQECKNVSSSSKIYTFMEKCYQLEYSEITEWPSSKIIEYTS
jgi:serine/threonine protein kinase